MKLQGILIISALVGFVVGMITLDFGFTFSLMAMTISLLTLLKIEGKL